MAHGIGDLRSAGIGRPAAVASRFALKKIRTQSGGYPALNQGSGASHAALRPHLPLVAFFEPREAATLQRRGESRLSEAHATRPLKRLGALSRSYADASTKRQRFQRGIS